MSLDRIRVVLSNYMEKTGTSTRKNWNRLEGNTEKSRLANKMLGALGIIQATFAVRHANVA